MHTQSPMALVVVAEIFSDMRPLNINPIPPPIIIAAAFIAAPITILTPPG